MDYDSLLMIFVSKDPLRGQMCAPFLWDVYAGATDGKSLILIPHKFNSNYHSTTLDIARVVSIAEHNFAADIPIERLKKALDSIPKIQAYTLESVQCSKCEGKGVIRCGECGAQRDCMECDGGGDIITEKAVEGKMIDNDKAIVGILQIPFLVKNVKKLIAAADFFKADKLSVVSNPNPTSAMEFIIGEARVFLAPIGRSVQYPIPD